MAGLLDGFFNPNDPQSMGLLSAASQILQQSGNTRQPYGLGQAMGTGIQGYMQGSMAARQMQQQAAEEEQQRQMRAMQIQQAQAQAAQQEAAMRKQQQLQQYMQAMPQGGAPALAQAPLSSAPQQSTPGMAQPQQQATGGAQDPFAERMARAAYLRQGGYQQEADGAQVEALKFQPEVKNWEKVMVGGQVLMKPYFKDGSTGAPVSQQMAEKLEFRTLGGRDVALNSYTGAEQASYGRTQSPESIASNNVAMRGQNLTDSRSRERMQFDRERATEQDAAGRGVIIQTDEGPMLANPRTGTTRQIIGPDGKPVTRTKPLTEFQGKSAAFGDRAMAADEILKDIGMKYSPAGVNFKNTVSEFPLLGGAFGAGANSMLSENSQKVDQAKRDFINATLRQESGAAIGAGEFANAEKQYFPQPGDSPAVIAQKAANRQLVINGFKRSAGSNAEFTPPKSADNVRKYNPKTGKIE